MKCLGCADRPRLADYSYCLYCQQEHSDERKFGADRQLAMEEIARNYGSTCKCCGSLDYLQVDHVNGDGAKHRGKLKGKSFYRWLRENNYPPGFQRLCRSCNASKSNGDTCRIHRKYLRR